MKSTLVWGAAAALLASCAGGPAVADRGTAAASLDGLEALADALADRDVVFLGEFHDNDVVHLQHAMLLRLLHQRRPELVLSMEMFERDVQERVDAYLAGEIDEAAFLETARPWPNYRQHYRPLVEFAKRHGIPVVAANLPRALASKVGAEGLAAIADSPFAAREVHAPGGDDPYWVAFLAAMDGHAGFGEATMRNFYAAQCAKDDTMAEAIVGAWSKGEPRPLVVHVNGDFHSARRLGTVERVLRRQDDLKLAVVGVETASNVRRVGEDFALVVPPQPDLPKEAASDDAGDAPAAAAPTGRPALGFMPDYESGVIGVLVAALREGGPAELAGVREGDVLIRVGDANIDGVEDYMAALGNLEVGKPAKIVVLRDGEEREFTVTVGERSENR